MFINSIDEVTDVYDDDKAQSIPPFCDSLLRGEKNEEGNQNCNFTTHVSIIFVLR